MSRLLESLPKFMSEFELLKRLRAAQRIFQQIGEGSSAELSLQKRLREEFDDDVVRSALTLRELRRKGEAKFSRARQMWFDRVGLEQATAEAVARYKAQRFSGEVWDLCSGIGSDAAALAERADVFAVDVNPAACLFTLWNAETYAVADNVMPICADVETLNLDGRQVHVDPDRRIAPRRRTIRVEECRPGLEFLQTLIGRSPGGAIKLSPAANFPDKFPGTEAELISLNGECKEATIWYGALAEPDLWRATVLPAGESIAGHPLDALAERRGLGRYLYDPDPAVVRSGLIDLLCEQQGFARLDDEEEYLTADSSIDSPFVRRFEVLAELANNDRAVRRFFRDAEYGSVEIKCRRLKIDVEGTRRRLSLKGKTPIVLIFARIAGKARAVICRRDDSPPAAKAE